MEDTNLTQVFSAARHDLKETLYCVRVPSDPNTEFLFIMPAIKGSLPNMSPWGATGDDIEKLQWRSVGDNQDEREDDEDNDEEEGEILDGDHNEE